MPSITQLLVLFLVVVVTFVPPILVLSSKRSHGGAKFVWFLSTLFFSWIAYAAFIIFTQKQIDPNA
jgi:hypothetical protein